MGSIFTGIAGLDLGLERAGFQVSWMVEIDPFRRSVLDAHWPTVKKFGDARRLRTDRLVPVDCVAGGFPCQPSSLAGKRLGTRDPRWLWPQLARIVGGLRPRLVLVENVPGLLARGGGMDEVVGGLARLGYMGVLENDARHLPGIVAKWLAVMLDP